MKHTKNIIMAVSTLGMAVGATLVTAECTTDMDAEMLAECITIEGSGANYQDWRAEYEQRMRGSDDAQPQQLQVIRSDQVAVSENRVK